MLRAGRLFVTLRILLLGVILPAGTFSTAGAVSLV
jgi:hypothetical protein